MNFKASDKIKEFTDFMSECVSRYNYAYESVHTEDKRTQDLLHAIEFEPHVEERSKMCTKLKKSRIERRESKDLVEELQPIIDFITDPANKRTMDKLTQVLGAVRKAERYHENRTYIPRVEVSNK